MKGLWRSSASPQQKWLVVVFLAVLLGALAPMLVRSFVPAPAVQRHALWLALLLTAGGGLLLRAWYRRGLWAPAGPWLDYGPWKRRLMLPLCVAFVTFILWLNLAMSLPMAYTALLGQPQQQATMVQKKRSSGRQSCRHQLQVAHIDYWLFEFCIDSDGFEQLPASPLPAVLSSRHSVWGEMVQSLRLSAPSMAEETEVGDVDGDEGHTMTPVPAVDAVAAPRRASPPPH